ncbi:nuclear transport factor 2 family protein [Brevundimonas sp. SORGH_AS_0993]|uniref:nuclear transport factor 2 family protein n=1 Tax=Brevundimonas sp. SORGH_AS_0993 TaxID=3041794 RepID=UPI00278844CB|nr:nuclear transport factor 2 family protein [Brevundimonas sp. SORGH_AS_0993]MDQ1155169.1 ketosteroid isomerase-like protein [Brevundimonas sp. SORGH_AS_0993]
MPDTQRNTAVVQRLYAGFATGDLEAVLADMAPDIQWTEAEGYPYAGLYSGPDAIVQGVFARLATEWEGYRAEPDAYVAQGDRVVALGHYSGRYLKTGKAFRAPFAHVWTLLDGKLVRFVQYTDTAVVMKALE